MSAAAAQQPERETGADGLTPRAVSLSVLEEALKKALDHVSREQVLERVLATLPHDGSDDEPGFHGRVSKVSVSMPTDLTAAVKRRTGAGGFSRYVTDAVQQRIRLDLLGDLLDELEEEYGPIPPEVSQQTRLMWPDAQP
jgi:hypothetical protein